MVFIKSYEEKELFVTSEFSSRILEELHLKNGYIGKKYD